MSYSKEVKHSLLKIEEKTNAERIAKIDGIVRSAGSLGISRDGVSFEINSENEDLIKKFVKLCKFCYDVEPDEMVENENFMKRDFFTVSYVPPQSEKILFDLNLLSLDENNEKCLNSSIGVKRFESDSVAINFLSGIFLGCGSICIPEKFDKENDAAVAHGKGYHLEMVFANENMANAIGHLLAEYNLMPKKVARRNVFVVYFKESEMICDFLALLGANKVVLELQNVIAMREVRNLANRQANCISGNIGKTVNAAFNQQQAIDVIKNTIGLEKLPNGLRELAVLREQYPFDSLDQLKEKLGGNITKSGINHRLRKLISIACDLGGN